MKKVIMAIAALALSATVSQADIRFIFSSGDFLNTPGSGGATNLRSADGYLFQVLWSASPADIGLPAFDVGVNPNAVDPGVDGVSTFVIYSEVIGSGPNAGDYGYVYGFDSGIIDNSAVGGANINSGFLYGRIFQDDTPDAGDAYYQDIFLIGGADAGGALPPPASPLPASATLTVLGQSGGAGQELMNTVVPEPSTLIMVLIGMGTIFVRRMRREV